MIGILNYGVGNLRSVYNAFEYLNKNVFFINSPGDFKKASGVVIPGVGHFKSGMTNIVEKNFHDPLNFYVKKKKIPCLGICLGMQLMAELGLEGDENKGLRWVPAIVKRIDYDMKNFKLRLPHIGWNEIKITRKNSALFKGMEIPSFYFVHSYFVSFEGTSNKEEYVTSSVDYGADITASFEKENIFAVQFHPEKSQQDGIKLLENFLKITKNA